MSDAPDRLPRWLVRTGVTLTILLCFGTAGYSAHVWWSKRVVSMILTDYVPLLPRDWDPNATVNAIPDEWRSIPCSGRWYSRYGWIPRRTYYEFLKRATNLDLGNNPDTWEAWFKAHPDLVWDEKQKLLVPASKTP